VTCGDGDIDSTVFSMNVDRAMNLCVYDASTPAVHDVKHSIWNFDRHGDFAGEVLL